MATMPAERRAFQAKEMPIYVNMNKFSNKKEWKTLSPARPRNQDHIKTVRFENDCDSIGSHLVQKGQSNRVSDNSSDYKVRPGQEEYWKNRTGELK